MTTLGNAQTVRTPTGLKVAAMSYVKLEDVAEQFRLLLPKQSGRGSSRWNIDAWRLLEQTLPNAKYRYVVAEKETLNEVAAFTVPEEGLVVVREDIYDGLFEDDPFSRSTVVHEFSHIALRHAATLHRGATAGKHEFFEDSEWQAKALTAALMMPIEACKAAASSQELATQCGTSVQAARYRLDNLTKRGALDPSRHADSLFNFIN
jgi:hypothetical protein